MTSPTAPTSTLRSTSGNWLQGRVGPFDVQALAFDEPSDYGMAMEPRISKLWVRLPGAPSTVLYDYDRNDLAVCRLTADGLAEIVAAVMAAV